MLHELLYYCEKNTVFVNSNRPTTDKKHFSVYCNTRRRVCFGLFYFVSGLIVQKERMYVFVVFVCEHFSKCYIKFRNISQYFTVLCMYVVPLKATQTELIKGLQSVLAV